MLRVGPVNLIEWAEAHDAHNQALRDQMDEFARHCAGYWLAIEHQEGLLTREQTDMMAQVMKTLQYHLGMDGHEIIVVQARNVAAHLLLLVPDWREQLSELAKKGPTF